MINLMSKTRMTVSVAMSVRIASIAGKLGLVGTREHFCITSLGGHWTASSQCELFREKLLTFSRKKSQVAMVEEEHFDCLVVGAGISGLDAAYHLQKHARYPIVIT